MQLFDFIKLLNKEEYSFDITPGPDWFDSIIVRVDTFKDIEEYEFTEEGLYSFVKYSETNRISAESKKDENELMTTIESLIDRPQKAWLQAAEDLNLNLISPFTVEDNTGKAYEMIGLLSDFGSGKGLVLLNLHNQLLDNLDSLKEYSTTQLNRRYYDEYDRNTFIEVLSDFGWNGDGIAPDWIKSKI